VAIVLWRIVLTATVAGYIFMPFIFLAGFFAGFLAAFFFAGTSDLFPVAVVSAGLDEERELTRAVFFAVVVGGVVVDAAVEQPRARLACDPDHVVALGSRPAM